MKRISFLCIIICFCVINLFAQKSSIDLEIKNSPRSAIVTFSIYNNSNKKIEVDDFNYTNRNRLVIFDCNGRAVSYSFIDMESPKISIEPGSVKTWEYDIEAFFNIPIRPLPLKSGKYKLQWTVNNMKARPFFYEFKNQ